jgi:hypothetical protein
MLIRSCLDVKAAGQPGAGGLVSRDHQAVAGTLGAVAAFRLVITALTDINAERID